MGMVASRVHLELDIFNRDFFAKWFNPIRSLFLGLLALIANVD